MKVRRVRVKWAGPNTPYIEVDTSGERLYITKEELAELLQEIWDFMEYYHESFEEDRIGNVDDISLDDL